MRERKADVYLLEERGYGKDNFREKFMEGSIAVMLLCGYLLCFFVLYSDMGSYWIFYAAGLVSLLLLFASRNRGRMEQGVKLGIFAAGFLDVAINVSGFMNGFFYTVNQCITAWNTTFDKYITLFALSSVTDMDRLTFGIFLVLLFSILVYWLIRKNSFFLLTILTYGILFFAVLAGISRGTGGVTVIMAGWLLFWVKDCLNHQSGRRNLLACMALLFFLGAAVFLTRNYQKIAAVSECKEAILDGIDRLRYGKDTLPQGNMAKADKMVGGEDEDKLVISFDEAQEMYLRGYVGSAYTMTGWDTLSEGAYRQEDTAGIMDWLNEQSFNPMAQYAEYRMSQGSEPDTIPIAVNNKGAYRKYLYTPYEVASIQQSFAQQAYDWQFRSSQFFGARKYTYTSAEAEAVNELLIMPDTGSEDAQQYVQAESIYRSFVYDHYLDIDDSVKSTVDTLFYNNQDWSLANPYQVTSQIRIILQEMAGYSEMPYEFPDDQEFISWFLTKAKMGNAAYFATAAAMAYRSVGIPARYVEGYYFSDAKAKKLNEEKSQTVTLTAHDAHAWTEIYLDGIGWMPVEVVPGFYYAEYTTQQVLDLPQSSVTVTDQSDQDELSGSTSDKLEAAEETKKKEPKTPVQRTIRILGMLLLTAILLEMFYLLLKLQREIRKKTYKRKLEKMEDSYPVLLYDRVSRILSIDRIAGSSDFPYERSRDIAGQYEKIAEQDYERFLELEQKAKFSGTKLQISEKEAMLSFVDKLTRESYENADIWKRIRMKYLYALL